MENTITDVVRLAVAKHLLTRGHVTSSASNTADKDGSSLNRGHHYCVFGFRSPHISSSTVTERREWWLPKLLRALSVSQEDANEAMMRSMDDDDMDDVFDGSELKRRFHALSLVIHPDRWSTAHSTFQVSEKDVVDADRSVAQSAFAAMSSSYTILSDPQRREVYNATLAAAPGSTLSISADIQPEALDRIAAASRLVAASIALGALFRDPPTQRQDEDKVRSQFVARPTEKFEVLHAVAARCARLGCLRELTAEDREQPPGNESTGVWCRVCRERPRKCSEFGCMMMVRDSGVHTKCLKHR